jgi:hypothetical protein
MRFLLAKEFIFLDLDKLMDFSLKTIYFGWLIFRIVVSGLLIFLILKLTLYFMKKNIFLLFKKNPNFSLIPDLIQFSLLKFCLKNLKL